MPKLPRNRHSLSHYRLATHDMGYLVPVAALEVLPGDKFFHASRVLMRVQPLLKPVMHPVEVRLHHWFVPNRLLWDDWDDFITRKDPELTIPTIDFTTASDPHPLVDHLGVPPTANQTLNALPIRAYNAIWNHAYRDQDLIDEVDLDDLELKRIAWKKDYFTTARLEPQQGDAAIDIPFSAGQAPVRGIGFGNVDAGVTVDWDVNSGADDVHESGGIDTVPANTDGNRWARNSAAADVVLRQHATATAYPNVYADLSNATAGININEFRQAMAQQRYLEHRNRYGSRHEDYLRFLGINPSDARLQNPEYLGGGKNTISFSEVLSTADSGSASVGDLSGHGISALSTRKYRRFFEESGIVLSLLSVRPETIYMQQLHRMWLRRTVFDFWQKELEMMGPQEIFTKELYGLHANSTDVFGYNGRHDEYRHHPSYVSGSFRDGGTEEDWHLGRDFSSSPSLNQSFLDCIPTDRIYADTATPELYSMISHNITAIRAVSKVAKY